MEEVDSSSSEAFVMVDGPLLSEAAHIYDRFFSDLAEKTYTASTIAAIQARRSHPDLEGRLYYDELLNLALMNNNDENEFMQIQQQGPSQLYPPKAESKDSIIELIHLIQSSSFDRIKKMALWYYIMLDLDVQGGNKKALEVAKEIGLPRSARYAMTGYWLLDRGQYGVAVSYLTEQPDFVPRIISTLSPLQYTSTSSEETKVRALALTQFLSLVDLEALDFVPDGTFEEARIVGICWSHGIREAWSQCQNMVTLDGTEDQDIVRAKCIGRILEYCFMPESKPDAIKALLALPLEEVEAEMLSHNIINLPPGIHFSANAHAIALDVLLVRRINSGQYYDAIMLDRRINDIADLPHLSVDVASDEEREKLRRLRNKRQDLIRSAHSVLTRVERQLLEVGDLEAGIDGEKGPGDRHDLEMSWEKVGENTHGEQSTPKKAIAASLSNMRTPLSASPALRKDKSNESASDTFLSAVIRASPGRGSRDISLRSGTGSPLSRSILQGSPIASRSNSLRHSIGSPRRTPSQIAPLQRDASASIYSPLASARSYKLPQANSSQQGEASQPSVLSSTHTVAPAPMEEVSSDGGPYSRLAQQIQEQMQENGGDLSVDRILGTKSSFRPLQSSNENLGLSSSSRKTTLTFSRPVRRYEAKYEIGQDGEKGEIDQDLQEQQDHDIEISDVPQRRAAKPASKGKTKALASRKPYAEEEHEDQDDTSSVPGGFPSRNTTGGIEKESKAVSQARAAPAKRRSTRRTARVADEESEDEVPEMIATPTIKKSRSGAALSRSRSATKMASTPIRRSARLSVEPESTPHLEGQRGDSASPVKEKRSRRATTSKGQPSASELEDTEPEKEDAGTGVATRSTRRRSKMPGSF